MEVGLIGLGVMGHNLALNIESRGYRLHVFNRTPSKTRVLVEERSNIQAHYSIESLVDGIKASPKIVILMVTSGEVVDAILEELAERLGPEDVVIDGGNSSYKDTIRRNRHRFEFVGCGISGGAEGARNGPSMMVGCDWLVWSKVRGLLESLSAVPRFGDGRCCVWLGENGAGHFVKMVHNGIEYGNMAIISEACLILKNLGLSNIEISCMLDDWNKTDLESYLLEISCKIMKARKEGRFVVDQIEDVSGQKGTGMLAVVESMDAMSPATVIAEAVLSRFVSYSKKRRMAFSRSIRKKDSQEGVLLASVLKDAFYLARAVSYVQGCNLLMSAQKMHGWEYTLQDISKVWSNGCILRGSFLEKLHEMGDENVDGLEITSLFISICNSNIDALKEAVLYSVRNEIPAPVISTCLMYLNGMKTENGPGNMIQALRDYFGAHEVVLKGEEHPIHIDWD